MKVQYSIFNFFNAHTLSTDTWDSQGIPPPLPPSQIFIYQVELHVFKKYEVNSHFLLANLFIFLYMFIISYQ